MKGSALPSAALLALAVGCAGNPYQQFYEGRTASAPVYAGRLVTAPLSPEIFRGGDQNADFIAMVEDGYLFLGYSSFNGTSATKSQVLEQARTVGAARVLVYSQHASTVTGTVPLVLPAQPTTAVTTAQGGVITPRGNATYTGTATTTVYGGTTTYQLPYRVDRYDQAASFWVKSKGARLGVYARDLSDEERRTLQRNGGATVVAIVKGSPAFAANILRGDIILMANDDAIQGWDSLVAFLDRSAGQEVSLRLVRAGQERVVSLRLGT